MTTSSIKALLVDDEPGARDNLNALLMQFCPDVKVIGEAANVDEAVTKIRNHSPHVVFLDIEMPGKSGFELIHAFETVDFYIVFVTAYDRYALKAFEVSAMDYLLKPVSIDRLKEAVRKVGSREQQKSYKRRFEALRTNTGDHTLKKISIPYRNDYAVINIEDIITIEADRMWSRLCVCEPEATAVKKYTYAKPLGYFKDLFKKNSDFRRVHNSWMINTRHIQFYSRKDRSVLLKNDLTVPVSKGYKQTFEAFLGL